MHIAHIYVYTCVHTYTHVFTYMHAFIYMYTYIYIHTFTYTHVHITYSKEPIPQPSRGVRVAASRSRRANRSGEFVAHMTCTPLRTSCNATPLPTFDVGPVKYIRFAVFFSVFWRVCARQKLSAGYVCDLALPTFDSGLLNISVFLFLFFLAGVCTSYRVF